LTKSGRSAGDQKKEMNPNQGPFLEKRTKKEDDLGKSKEVAADAALI